MKITFIGGGNMAQAIISGIKKNNINCEILVSEPMESKRNYLEKFYGIKTSNNNIISIKNSDFIILAIKPQIFPDIAEEINSYLGSHQTVVSIMAGITLGKLNKYLNHKNIIRVMPNTPAQIGKGSSIWMKLNHVEKNKINFFKKILLSCGIEIEVNNEKLIDIATAISGSGPAYILFFMESLINSGIELGLEEKLAEKIVYETVLGSAYLARNSKKNTRELIDMVTSPGGTTAAGLSVLNSLEFNKIINSAIQSAYERGIEISKGEK